MLYPSRSGTGLKPCGSELKGNIVYFDNLFPENSATRATSDEKLLPRSVPEGRIDQSPLRLYISFTLFLRALSPVCALWTLASTGSYYTPSAIAKYCQRLAQGQNLLARIPNYCQLPQLPPKLAELFIGFTATKAALSWCTRHVFPKLQIFCHLRTFGYVSCVFSYLSPLSYPRLCPSLSPLGPLASFSAHL